jgi:hypothetical protein
MLPRGMKIISFLLAGLSIALISSASLPQPVHAEGFLSQTVRCLVQTLLFTDCQRQPAPSAPTASPAQTQPSEPGASSNSGSPSGSVSKSASPQQPISHVQPPAALQPQTLPDMTEASPEMYVTPQTLNYVAYFNMYSKYATHQGEGASNLFIEPSREGWKVAGIAWYWWAVILIGLTGIIMYTRHWRVRRSSALSKYP